MDDKLSIQMKYTDWVIVRTALSYFIEKYGSGYAGKDLVERYIAIIDEAIKNSIEV